MSYMFGKLMHQRLILAIKKLLHPTRRQIFAGKSDSTFYNIWDLFISGKSAKVESLHLHRDAGIQYFQSIRDWVGDVVRNGFAVSVIDEQCPQWVTAPRDIPAQWAPRPFCHPGGAAAAPTWSRDSLLTSLSSSWSTFSIFSCSMSISSWSITTWSTFLCTITTNSTTKQILV